MTEISKKEIEAAIKAFQMAHTAKVDIPLEQSMRDALEAAARVRAENDAFRDAVVTGLGAVKMNADGSAERVDLRAEPSGKIEEAAQIIQAFIDQEVDYMTRNNLGNPEKQHNVKWGRKWLSALTAGKLHPDDEAVDRFAAAMKAKLKWEREERGRYGWNNPEVCSEEYLAKSLIEHLAKGNDGNFEDVANFCMMLHQRGAHPRVLADAFTAGKPVAWRYKLFESDPEWTVTTEKPKGAVVEPLFTRPSEQAVTEADKSDDAVAELFFAAWAEADKAMRKFPQPNYVISKVAEEAGEVVKAAIHCAEGRETPENVVAEIKQAMAMLIRLYVEGDQVHGLPALKAAMEAGRQARVRAEANAGGPVATGADGFYTGYL